MNKRTSIIGLGHVGLLLAVKIASLDRQVFGFDTDSSVISSLRNGIPPFFETGLSELLKSPSVRINFHLIESWLDVSKSDVIVITVGTPISVKGEPLLKSLDDCTDSLGKVLKSGQLVIYRSTIPPGTLRGRIMPMLERASGLSAGKDFQLAYSPERLVEGVALREIIDVPHIIGGLDDDSSKSAANFFESLGSKCIIVSRPEVAEMAKIMDNVYRDTNIALANEFSLACEKLGIDVMESIKAANTSPRTKMLTPGCGVGGSCLNKDPYVLISMMGNQVNLPVISSSRKTNEAMPSMFAEFLANKIMPSNPGGIITLLGISFKAGTDDTRGTVTTTIAKKLLGKGFMLKAFDPLVSPQISEKLLPNVEISISLEDAVRGSAAIVLCSDHEQFKNMNLAQIKQIVGPECVLFDGRNIMNPFEVVSAGFRYVGLGRSISSE
ncbi:MAG: nucleotide sugar dehydrogenase [Thaumarchaeota archaeon]|nr:nucleotide sugar dehydrogenase [Nitrososphaerota archaeon]